MFIFSIGLYALYQCSAIEVDKNQTAWLYVNASQASARKIPKTLFGVFFEVNILIHDIQILFGSNESSASYAL